MILLAIVPIACGLLFQDFFNKVDSEINQGAKWHYVGKQSIDPNAKSIPLQLIVNGQPVGDLFILWKLEK